MKTKIAYINYDKSLGLQQEIEAFKQGELNFDLVASEKENLEKYPTPETYCDRYLKHHAGVELERHVKKFKIIFNESLHHCDEPVRALKNC